MLIPSFWDECVPCFETFVAIYVLERSGSLGGDIKSKIFSGPAPDTGWYRSIEVLWKARDHEAFKRHSNWEVAKLNSEGIE